MGKGIGFMTKNELAHGSPYDFDDDIQPSAEYMDSLNAPLVMGFDDGEELVWGTDDIQRAIDCAIASLPSPSFEVYVYIYPKQGIKQVDGWATNRPVRWTKKIIFRKKNGTKFEFDDSVDLDDLEFEIIRR